MADAGKKPAPAKKAAQHSMYRGGSGKGHVKYTDAVGEEICVRIALGETLRSICRDDHMPDRASAIRWAFDHPVFAPLYSRARIMSADTLVDDMQDIADTGANDYMEKEIEEGRFRPVVDNEALARSKLRIQTRQWLATKLNPAKYRDTAQLDVKHSVSDMSDGELEDEITRAAADAGIPRDVIAARLAVEQ